MNNQKNYTNRLIIAFSIILLVVLVWSVFRDELKVVEALFLWGLGSVTISFFMHLIKSMENRELPGIESFWGGIDGGIGGWQISRAASYLFGFLLFSLVFFLGADRISNNIRNSRTIEQVSDSLLTIFQSKLDSIYKLKQREEASKDSISNQTDKSPKDSLNKNKTTTSNITEED